MDFLNAGLDLVQSRLAWVATDPFDWKLYLQVSSWGVCLFESYLLYVSSLLICRLSYLGLWRWSMDADIHARFLGFVNSRCTPKPSRPQR